MAMLFPILAFMLAMFFQEQLVDGLDASGWSTATATSCTSANPTGGACGYNNIKAEEKYGAAVSAALFKEGISCGQCYKIKCDIRSGSKFCRDGSSVTVVAASFFPPQRALLINDSDLKPADKHFHLAKSAWEEISSDESKVVPVLYQRVSCTRQGGVQFTMYGQSFFTVVLISNVGGDGAIKSVSIKGITSSSWIAMSRNYGANWHSNVRLTGQSISFSVTLANGQNLKFEDVVPPTWSFGQTYSSLMQFN